ncbi:spore coat associated protein CotJA [Oscillospiraceae bacterium MB08-C2-2]|nr:spore coat associated protein CotJA [Oscillospiraceae bacterium MB08-C2-2]
MENGKQSMYTKASQIKGGGWVTPVAGSTRTSAAPTQQAAPTTPQNIPAIKAQTAPMAQKAPATKATVESSVVPMGEILPPKFRAIPVPMPMPAPAPSAASEAECGYCITLGMAYVPKQLWQKLYEPEIGFGRGTIFSELDMPFIGEEVPRK